jgi:hypothetical protein
MHVLFIADYTQQQLKVGFCFGQLDDLGFSLEDKVSNRALENLLGLGMYVAARAQYLDREALMN